MGQKYKLNDLAYRKLEYGSGAAATEYDGSVRYIRISDIDENGKLNDTVVSPSVYDDKYTLKDGDILFARTGATVGKTYRFKETDGNFIFAGFLIRFSPNTSLVLPDYVYYFTKSPQYRQFVLRNMKVVAQPNINAKQYGDLEFYVHSLKEQGCIVDKLIKIERLIDLRKEQLELLDNLIKSRFVEMFGDPVHNPLGWNIKPFLECGSCKNGMNFGTGETGVELQYLGVGDFKNLTKIEEVTKLGQVCLNKMPSEDYMLKNGDIIFVRSNGNKALVGRCLAIYPNGIPTTYSGFCIRYRKTDESLEIPYLLQVLKTESMRLMMAGRGANIQNLNQQILGQLQIPIPPNNLQREFGQFIEQVDKLKVAY